MNLGLLKYKQSEGKVYLKEDKLPEGVILCDILQDWIYELQEMYDEQVRKTFVRSVNKGETK
jgi:hypothetical protein